MTKFDAFCEKILNLVILLAASMLTVPAAWILFSSQTRMAFDGAQYLMPFFAVLSVFFGYFIQKLYAKITGCVASADGFAVQGAKTITHFRVRHALLPILIFILTAVLVFFLSNAFFRILYTAGKMEYIHIIYGIAAALLFFFSALLGCVIWFYPMERLTNSTVLITAGVLFYAEMFLATLTVAPLFSMGLSVLNHSSVTAMIGPPFIIFTVCILVIFNQSNMQKKFRGSVVSVITPSARMYNLLLVLTLLLILILASALMYVVIGGIYIIFYAIFFVIAYHLFYGKTSDPSSMEYEYVDSDVVSKQFRQDVMSPENQYLLAVFFLLILTAAAVFVLAKTGKLRLLIERIRTWFRDLLESFLIGKDIFRNAGDPDYSDEICNYKDEKKKLQNASIRDFYDLASQTDNYKYFMSRLGRLKSYDEQLCYAYAVLLKMYKKNNINLKSSDTPREVENKVRRSLSTGEIEKITNDFEQIRYAQRAISDSEAASVLHRICSVIKRYMY